MSFVRNLSVRTKLLSGFGIVVLLSAITAVTLLSELGTVNAGGVYVGSNSLQSISAIKQIDADANKSRSFQLAALLDSDPASISTDVAEVASLHAAIAHLLTGYRAEVSDAIDARDWHAAQAAWTAYLAAARVRDGLDSMALDPHATLAQDIRVTDATNAKMAAVDAAIATWAAHKQTLATAKLASNASAYGTARLIGITLLIVAVLLAVAIALGLAQMIRSTVTQVLGRATSLQEHCSEYLLLGLRALAEGDLTQEFTPVTEPIANPAGDEIGQVAQAVNGLRDRLVASILAYNETRGRLAEMVGAIQQSSQSVTSASDGMSSISEETGRAVGEIAQAIGGSPRAPSARSRSSARRSTPPSG